MLFANRVDRVGAQREPERRIVRVEGGHDRSRCLGRVSSLMPILAIEIRPRRSNGGRIRLQRCRRIQAAPQQSVTKRTGFDDQHANPE